MSKQECFEFLRNGGRLSHATESFGRLFHSRAPAMENDRSPTVGENGRVTVCFSNDFSPRCAIADRGNCYGHMLHSCKFYRHVLVFGEPFQIFVREGEHRKFTMGPMGFFSPSPMSEMCQGRSGNCYRYMWRGC